MTASATLTLLVGAILVAASLLRLGFVANFISEPVLTGFKAGIGLVIVLDQVPKLLGIHFHKGPFFHNLAAIAGGLPDASPVTVAVGVVTLLVLVAIERFFPRVPAPLIAVAGGVAGVSLLGLQAQGVSTVGQVPTGPAVTHHAGPRARRGAVAGCAGHRAHELHRDDRGGPGVRPVGRAHAATESRIAGDRASRTREARCSARCRPAAGRRRLR